ncbi:trichoplein keratin filament-binding protein [Drosophila hydei]|uniref:Trichoplein keratin filament-binding protein n=1 Tax=Drosophila hydei TaxID=7224 RepID=A0A6J1MAT9_DROHY|nr:trichoplein keratin filament-binding protein [Drosophila hydei]XP_023178462.2 trichoplein keratin filament-binding protein [Drosophila hydei]
MSGRLNHQHAAYAWRQEQVNNRVEAIQQVNRYYDHWGQVTSRYENWTNKEYYDKADKQLQQRKTQQQKELELNERRIKLRQLLDQDNNVYDLELGRKRRPRDAPADIKTLESINQSIQEQEQLKRKLELEAKLYGRWRHGVDDEKLLYQSKSNNEVLAKLNWLDKQIEQEQHREEREALAAEQQLLLQQEMSRTEQAQKERQLIREQEIKDIRALQESHMAELKERQGQAEKLKQEEQNFRLFITELEKEKSLLEESTALMLRQSDVKQAFNQKKIKIFIRNRNEAFCKQILLCINLLERIAKYAIRTEQLQGVLNKCKDQLENEKLAANQIDTMYESEAKYQLQKCEENWREQHLQRFGDINRIIEQEQQLLSGMLRENVTEQESIVELRATHIAGIEQATKKLEQLIKEDELSSPRSEEGIEAIEAVPCDKPEQPNACPSQIDAGEENDLMPKVSDSFTNLNLDVWQDLPPVRGRVDTPRLDNTRSMNVVDPLTSVPPKFARKRVVWT